jgi:hypothetical protein
MRGMHVCDHPEERGWIDLSKCFVDGTLSVKMKRALS